jgi:hypothetical protein
MPADETFLFATNEGNRAAVPRIDVFAIVDIGYSLPVAIIEIHRAVSEVDTRPGESRPPDHAWLTLL